MFLTLTVAQFRLVMSARKARKRLNIEFNQRFGSQREIRPRGASPGSNLRFFDSDRRLQAAKQSECTAAVDGDLQLPSDTSRNIVSVMSSGGMNAVAVAICDAAHDLEKRLGAGHRTTVTTRACDSLERARSNSNSSESSCCT